MFENVEKAAAQMGVTLYEIAKACGISTATIYQWKAGRYTPKAETRRKIAQFLGVTLEYIDTGSDSHNQGFSQEVLQIAQEMKDNGILASAFVGLSKEDMRRVADFALALKSTYRED